MRHKPMNRRAFLKGAGTIALSLPFMDIFSAEKTFASASVGAPRRLITVFFANGCPPDLWMPSEAGANFEFKPALAPLARHREKLAIISGLSDFAGKAGSGDDHSRGSGAFAVGVSNPFLATDSFDANGKRYGNSAGGPSIEQYALQYLKPETYLSSLEIGLMRGTPFTRTYHIKSWRGINQPNPPLLNPLDTFHRIFGYADSGEQYPDAQGEARDKRYQASILDTVIEDYQRLTSDRYGLDGSSRAMIADHLDAVRDLERRAIHFEREMLASCTRPDMPASYVNMRYSDYEEVFKLQADLFAIALRCDITRFGSVMIGAGAEGFRLPGFSQGQHELGHQWNANPTNKLQEYTSFQMKLISYLLDQLDDPLYMDANNRTVLENSVVLIGTEIAHPSFHSHDDMFYMIAGGASAIRTGYHHRVGDGTDRSLNDLYTACLNAIGIETATFGDARFCSLPINLG